LSNAILRVGFTKWPLFASIALSLVGVASLAYALTHFSRHSVEIDEFTRLSRCETESLGALKPQPQVVDLALLKEVHSVCYERVAKEDILLDFQIRKDAYREQQATSSILTWLVVAITLSGIVLAGLQLMAGYKLASLGKEGFGGHGADLGIEPSKISIKSSVTGLAMLAISLAFFMVFVTNFYKAGESRESPSSLSPSVSNTDAPLHCPPVYLQPRSSIPIQPKNGPEATKH